MARLRPFIGITALIALTFAVAGSVVGQVQPGTDDAVLRALLTEIRTLRLSLQRNSAFELRGKLLLDRARMHQENIRELSREVENSADVMRPTSVEPAWESDAMMMDVTSAAPGMAVPDPEQRKKMIEREKAMMERRRAMEAQHREQMRQRFQRMETRLAEEREKLRAIEEELAQMHKELTETPAPAK